MRSTKKRNEQVINDYRLGIKIPELAKKYIRSEYTIKKILKNNGIQIINEKREAIKNQTDQKIFDLYEQGLSKNKMKYQYNISNKRVDEAFRRHGKKYVYPKSEQKQNELLIVMNTGTYIYFKTNKTKAQEAFYEFKDVCESVGINIDNIKNINTILRDKDYNDIDEW